MTRRRRRNHTASFKAKVALVVGRRRPPPGLLHHSDRGSQYASRTYRETLAQQRMVASMSRKGNCWDNAVIERFFGSLKSEGLAGQRYLTREQARRDIVQYIEMEYNSNRLHSTLGYVTPTGTTDGGCRLIMCPLQLDQNNGTLPEKSVYPSCVGSF